MKIYQVLMLTLPLAFSFSFYNTINATKSIASFALDFVPGVSNVKNLGEAITGKDLITRKNLTKTERTFSLLGVIPFGKFLKSGKHFKNAINFMKAAKRAEKAGKIKNAVKFAKAGARAMKKANKAQDIIKGLLKTTNGIFKNFGFTNKEKEEEDDKKNGGKGKTFAIVGIVLGSLIILLKIILIIIKKRRNREPDTNEVEDDKLIDSKRTTIQNGEANE